MKLEGATDWQKHGTGSNAILVSDLIVTLKNTVAWAAGEKPQWFLAFPSSQDDPAGTRDYIIMKGTYEWGEVPTAAGSTGGGAGNYFYRQTVEYYQ